MQQLVDAPHVVPCHRRAQAEPLRLKPRQRKVEDDADPLQ